MKIKIYRLDWTPKGMFGHLNVGNFDCVTLERIDTLIPEGIYKAKFYNSPANKCVVVLLEVPGRSYIEIHPADRQEQLKGCIALATRRKGIENLEAEAFAADLNKKTFCRFMECIKGATDLEVEIK